uniref:Dihydrolipoyl dehydrogenase n=1 Tax=uncultured Bacteroidota bacterium TaxID=152509 RepID=H5SMB6_9BACT|nr:dihydrolipoamide dehydrogenase [uncultured Bacteroidetes bacterium]
MERYDVVVIGSGPGGYVAAIRAAQLGLSVALVERYPSLGGTCLNVGCIPSKALLDSSEKYYEAQRHFAEHGIQVENVKVDWKKMLARKAAVVKQTVGGVEYLMKKNRIAVHYGHGRFLSANEVAVEGGPTLYGKHIIVATGSKPASLPGIPIDKKRIITSTEALSLPEVPGKLLIIGGGVIGVEMASIFGRLGSEITIVEYLDRLLPGMDAEAAEETRRFLVSDYGAKVLLGHAAQSAEVGSASVRVQVAPRAGGDPLVIEADYVLVAVGRRPYTEGLDLEKAGLATDERGRVPVNDSLQTAVPHIYAIGDVIRGPMLAHKASEDGVYVAERIAGRKPHLDYRQIPSVVYIWPEVAGVGYTQEELEKEGRPYRMGKFPYRASGRARAAHETRGFVKVLADARTDMLLGMHVVGPRAADLIAVGVAGLAYGASAEDLFRLPLAHPTFSEALREAALAASEGSPLHL